MTDEELFEQARDISFAYRAAVADVQLEILDGEWWNRDYGDVPNPCGDDSYEFRMSRGTPDGWHLDGTPMELAERVAAWLDENGWSDIKLRGYSGEIGDVAVEAAYPAQSVELLVVDISPGEVFDSVTVYGTSSCQAGDNVTISKLRRPGDAPPELKPELEHPSAEPSFGYTEDGKRRFWSETE